MDDGGWDRFLGMNSGSVIIGAGYEWKPTTFNINQWQHIALVYSGNTVRFYKNGIEYSAPTTHALGMSTASLSIGCRTSPSTEFFGGKLDEVRIWSTASSRNVMRQIGRSCNISVEGRHLGTRRCRPWCFARRRGVPRQSVSRRSVSVAPSR